MQVLFDSQFWRPHKMYLRILLGIYQVNIQE
jgi:hypothetical protein